MKFVKYLFSGFLVIIVILSVALVQPENKYFEIARNLDIFATLFKEVNAFYVDEVEPDKVIRTGIDAMLASLDPYTNYIPEDDLEAYSTMIQDSMQVLVLWLVLLTGKL